MNLPLPLRFTCLTLVLMLLPSCGLSFRSAWKTPASNAGVCGKWEGAWLSTASGHTGQLRAVIHPMASRAPEGQAFQFFYHCTWRGILSAAFKTTQQVEKQTNGTYTFRGDHQMPNWVGGVYHYEGTIKGDDFNACYESTMDRGTFTMKRVR